MITVTLVNLPGSYLSALYGISDILGYANDLSGSIFDVSIRDPDDFVRHPPASGLAVIPPFRVDRDGIQPDPAVVKALKGFAARGGIPVSVCAGAFYLCAAGLADGHRITTHWQLAGHLQKSHPEVTVCRDRILVDEGSIISAGGITGFQDLSLYLIRKYLSAEAALSVASIFLLNTGERSQLQYARMDREISGSDDILSKARQFMHDNLNGEIGLEEIAGHCGVTVRTLLRRFHTEGGQTPIRYLQTIRIEHARRLFETTGWPVKEISFMSGYRDLVAFTRVFKRQTGLTPGEYRKKRLVPDSVPVHEQNKEEQDYIRGSSTSVSTEMNFQRAKSHNT